MAHSCSNLISFGALSWELQLDADVGMSCHVVTAGRATPDGAATCWSSPFCLPSPQTVPNGPPSTLSTVQHPRVAGEASPPSPPTQADAPRITVHRRPRLSASPSPPRASPLPCVLVRCSTTRRHRQLHDALPRQCTSTTPTTSPCQPWRPPSRIAIKGAPQQPPSLAPPLSPSQSSSTAVPEPVEHHITDGELALAACPPLDFLALSLFPVDSSPTPLSQATMNPQPLTPG